MKTRFGYFHLSAALFLFSSVATAQSPDFLSLDQIKPGMKGFGKTIFRGVQVEEFGVEVLGVLENIRPRQNLILAKLSGEQVEQTGVFAGMSGSPVYIENKLVGAVAFSFPFSKEPIAGITPISEMVEVFSRRPGGVASSAHPMTTGQMQQVVASPQSLPLTSRSAAGSLSVETGWAKGFRLVPIDTPVSFSGLSPEVFGLLKSRFEAIGLAPLLAVGSGRASDFGEATLEPGSTLAVQLIRGDLDVSAVGTVTHVSGNRVYAFGHPFLGAGFTDLPMSKGAVLTVISSLSTSQKVAASGEAVGSIKQDRATGVLGVIGDEPELIPLQVDLLTSRNEKKVFNYEVITDTLLTPLLITLAVYNSISSSESLVGSQTLKVQCTVAIKDQPEVKFENSVSDLVNSSVNAALVAAAPVSFLLTSGFEELEVEQIGVSITVVEQTRKATVDKVWVDRDQVRPGEEVRLTVFLRKPNGETVSENIPIKIPEQISPGPLQLLVGEGLSVSKIDSDSSTSEEYEPENVRQLIRAINNLKKNDRLYVRVYRTSPGVIVGGEGLPGLPPSFLELYGSSRTSGETKAIDKVIFVEHEMPPTEFVLEGSQTVEVEVQS